MSCIFGYKPLWERGRKCYRLTGQDVMQDAAGSFPDQPFAVLQNLGRGYLLKACATQTLPARVKLVKSTHQN